MRIHKGRALAAALILAVITVAACGGGDDAADTTTTTTAATDTTTAAGDGTGTTIEITVQGDRFSTDEIRVKAGQEVTIVVNDIDTETDDPHNFHVRAAGQDFFTNIEPAPNVQELTFTIQEPGTYEFFCDTHLLTMNGEFIVEP